MKADISVELNKRGEESSSSKVVMGGGGDRRKETAWKVKALDR
jgi:hypothetical protein